MKSWGTVVQFLYYTCQHSDGTLTTLSIFSFECGTKPLEANHFCNFSVMNNCSSFFFLFTFWKNCWQRCCGFDRHKCLVLPRPHLFMDVRSLICPGWARPDYCHLLTCQFLFFPFSFHQYWFTFIHSLLWSGYFCLSLAFFRALIPFKPFWPL